MGPRPAHQQTPITEISSPDVLTPTRTLDLASDTESGAGGWEQVPAPSTATVAAGLFFRSGPEQFAGRSRERHVSGTACPFRTPCSSQTWSCEVSIKRGQLVPGTNEPMQGPQSAGQWHPGSFSFFPQFYEWLFIKTCSGLERTRLAPCSVCLYAYCVDRHKWPNVAWARALFFLSPLDSTS